MKNRVKTFLRDVRFVIVCILVISILSLLSSCKKKEQGTMWKVAFIDTHIKSQDYIYNFEGKGCKCGYQPYLLGSTFYKELVTDSIAMVNKFHQTYDDGYILYAVYPYCSADDWKNNPRDIEYFDKRSTMVSSMDICLKYGLIDSSGHYIN
jgi:hypothetical protein